MENRIKEIIKRDHYGTLTRLAWKIGVSRVTVSNIANDKTDGSLKIVKKICDELGYTFEDIFFTNSVKHDSQAVNQ